MAVTPEQLRNAAAIRGRGSCKTSYRYQAAKELIELIASNPMPTLEGLRTFGPYCKSAPVGRAYYLLAVLTAAGKHSKANIDRVYKMIHG